MARLIRPTHKGLRERGWKYVKIDGKDDTVTAPPLPEKSGTTG